MAGVGVDCIGTFSVPAVRCGYTIEDEVRYSRSPQPRTLLRLVGKNVEWISFEDAGPGDGIVFWIVAPHIPQHVGMYTGSTVIHALMNVERVTEHSLGAWREKIYRVGVAARGIVDLPEGTELAFRVTGVR